MIYILHQKGPAGTTCSGEFWTLIGIGLREGAKHHLDALGWTWNRGPQGGAWTTESKETALWFVKELELEIREHPANTK